MILYILASILSAIYPWSVEAGAFISTGDWNTGATYQAQSAYVSVDRYRKDNFIARLHRMTLDGEFYNQWTASGSGLFWWRSELKFGGSGGMIYEDIDGWFYGPHIEGVLGPIGYTADYLYLQLEQNLALNLLGPVSKAHHAEIRLRRQIGPFLLEGGVHVSGFDSETYLMPIGAVSGWMNPDLFVSAGLGIGEAQWLIEPSILLPNLNPDLMTAWYQAGFTIRLSPHWYTHFEYRREDYQPDPRFDLDYTAHYGTIGLNLRY